MVFVKLQNSGFEYEVTATSPRRLSVSKTVTIRNIITKETLFKLNTRINSSSPPAVFKNFYGLDDRYYHIHLSGKGGHITAGQITPSGAVIGDNRTILKHVSFYPVYMEGISKPEILKPVIKPPAFPVVSASPAVVSIVAPPITTKEEISCLKKIKNLLIKIKMWIINLLNR